MQDEGEYHDEHMEQLAFIGGQQSQVLQQTIGDWRQQQQQTQQQKQAANVVRVPSLQSQSHNDKNRIAPLSHFFYSEDLRISRILRRLLTETSPAAAIEICEKLEIAVRSPSNAAYICRSLEMLLDNVVQILKQCPVECVQQMSNILGIIGYVSRSSFPIYSNFISKTYLNSKSLQKYLMIALKSTLRCDAVNLDLVAYSELLLERLIDYLENAEKADIFVAVSETIVEFSKNYERAFTEHFTDIVDIVVGWHLETDQPQSLKLHCSLVLQKWAAYFLNELEFTYGLLGQFLEDINVWYEDLTAEGATKKVKIKAELRISAFIGAFTTILKSISTPTDFVGINADRAFIENAVGIIMKTAKETFSQKFIAEEIVYNINDFLSSLLAHNYAFKDIRIVEELIELEIDHLKSFNTKQIETLLYTILCLCRHQRTSISLRMLTIFLSGTPLTALKLTHEELVYKLLLKIYHEILMLKNVPLLQEAYKHIKLDINDAIQVFTEASRGNEISAGVFACAVQKFNFYLSALSVLATQTSSIISMYALDPSILELLIDGCKVSNSHIWAVEPTLHNALLKLLAIHCQKNRNFINSSRLLNNPLFASQVLEEKTRNSPTSEHFMRILQFFASILDANANGGGIGHESFEILLKWMQQLLVECSEHMVVLMSNEEFIKICIKLCSISTIEPIEIANCMRILLKNSIPIELQERIRDVAIYQINSTNEKIAQSYAEILGILPLSVSLAATNLCKENSHHLSKMYELEKWYRGTTHFAPLRIKYFKEFLDYLDVCNHPSEKKTNETEVKEEAVRSLEQIFSRCFTVQNGYEKATQYQQIARHQRLLTLSWMQCEAARYCVRNKLRTTVGKPQETFLAIEAILMKYARLLAAPKEASKDQKSMTLEKAMELQHKARVLLGFLESLEKQIYNAAQGTAFAIPPNEKAAKTFFRINASTCKEWFKRIRSAVCLVATHCIEPEMVIRYAEQSLAKPDQINEHTLISLVGAYLQRNEGDSLHGLYVWIRARVGKNLLWIQYAAEQASGHLEQAAIGYRSLLEENPACLEGAAVKAFVKEQLMHCLYLTGQWREIQSLFRIYAEKNESLTSLTHMYSDAHLETIHTLCYGNEDKMEGLESERDIVLNDAFLQLMDWSTCGGATASSSSGLKEKQSLSTSISNFSSNSVLGKLEEICIIQTLKGGDDGDHLSDDILQAVYAGLRESYARGCNLDEPKIMQSNAYVILNHVIQKLLDKEDFYNPASIVSGNMHDDSTVLMKSLFWTLLLEQRAHVSGNYMDVPEKCNPKHLLYLDMATFARRNTNYDYCRRMLKRFFAMKGFHNSLEDISMRLRNNEQSVDIMDDSLLRGISELSKCLYNSTTAATDIVQQNQNDAINLSSAMCSQIVEQMKNSSSSSSLAYPAIGAKTLLTLSEWLGQRNVGNSANNPNIAMSDLAQLQELLKKLPETSVQLSDDEFNISMPAIDKAVGRLINASISQRNDVGEVWLAYGNWCYRWGKKLVELKNVKNQSLPQAQINDQCRLSERDLNDIKSILNHSISDEVLQQIAQILQNHQLGSKSDVVDDEIVESADIVSVESIQQELRKIKTLADISEEELTGIIRIWRRTHKTVYAYYETAIRAYLKYLSIETSDKSTSSSSSSSSSSATTKDDRFEDSGFVTTTLRLLRLVVKHAFALQDVLEEGLNTTPLRPWRVIIPQLFSRLNHHEPYVRNSLAQLLCRLAQQEPHAVIFPAVVGSHEEGTNNNASSSSCQEPPATTAGQQPTTSTNTIALSNCFSSLVSSLAKQAPETVRHVQLLVKELRRVALLWEEFWLHALGRLLTEYSPIFSGLAIETRKCNRSNVQQIEKLKAKHELLLQYVLADLKKISSTTEKDAETKYEANFKQHYQRHIEQTIDELAQPEEMLTAGPMESWQKLKNLYQRFQQRSMHSSTAAASTLKISDLSPILTNMLNTAICMPGVEGSSARGDTVYIRSIESAVHVLPTKTRPKKLVFLGSDGRKYTYLFKGLEDLHLDERIMQFLSISNLMMERTRDHRLQSQKFRAHYYSVIPLGPQSGLISWVDGVTPLFGIYKRWQQRDAALIQQQNKERPTAANVEQQQNIAQQQQQQQQQNSGSSPHNTALRPSELFYKKLRPLLSAQNVKLKDPRKQWPLSILRRVLDELTEETPNDLLSKELWCHSTSAAEWKKTVRNYSTSMAVMSVIGYIIGLGDRHLDNVLINLGTGEIVHIDYNVCFEKGKTLRVPEKVPFRLTPNLENALGVTGVEGTFRLGCEYVLKTLRKEKETLLTLLEAFVYDPLVDWTVSDDGISGGTTRATLAYSAMQSVTSLKLGTPTNPSVANILSRESPLRVSKQYEMVQRRQDWELMQQTIKTRFEDIRSPWSEYIQEMQQQLSKIATTSKELSDNIKSIQDAEEERKRLSHQVAMIRELKMLGTAIGSHSLNTITQRFQSFKQDEAALEKLRKSAKIALNDIETLVKTYFSEVIGDNKDLMLLQKQLFEQEKRAIVGEFELVRNYMQKISEKFYEDANFARKEMNNSLQQEARSAMELIKCLDQYARIMDFYPRSKLREGNAIFRYANWYSRLWNEATDLKALKIEVEKSQIRAFNDADKKKILEYANSMEKISYEINMDLHKLVMSEANLQQQQPGGASVDSVITEIKDFASIDNNTCSTLQVAMLLVLTETLVQLEQSGRTPNIFKEIDFIEKLEFVFEQLQLKPKSLQQFSEQKLLKSLRNLLQALHDFELETIYERTVQLFFLDDHLELQECLAKLCNGDIASFKQPDHEKDDALKLLQSLLVILQYHFASIEGRLHQLREIIKEILEIEACSWYNILLERLSVIQNLSDSELTAWKRGACISLFCVARDQVNSFKSNFVDSIYDVRNLYMPLRNYVKSIHGKYLHGVTIALTEAYISSFQTSIEFVDCNAAARLLCNKLATAVQHNFELKQLDLQKVQLTQYLNHYTRVCSAYVWANQSIIDDTNSATGNLAHIVVKEKLLLSIGNAKQSMSAWKHTIIKIQDEIAQHTEIVQQRLRWIVASSSSTTTTDAAAVVDDSINDIISRFEETAIEHKARYDFFLQLAVKLIENASTLMQFESLMEDNIAGLNTQRKAEEAFMALIDDWQKVRLNYAQSNALITPVEKGIVQLLDPEDKIDSCWISNITGLLDEMIFTVQRDLGNLEEEQKTLQDRLYMYANEIQSIIESPLRTDMRQLLRLIIKNAKYPIRYSGGSAAAAAPHPHADENSLTNIAREVLHLLKILSGKLGDLKTKLCTRDEHTFETLDQLNEKLKDAQNAINEHMNVLNSLVQHYLEQNYSLAAYRSNPARVASPATATDKGKEYENLTPLKDSFSTVVEKKGEQKRNVYAVSVWKRIRMKLEGRDPDGNKRSNITEQVDFIINEAINRDNLAVLYEGWTPWV